MKMVLAPIIGFAFVASALAAKPQVDIRTKKEVVYKLGDYNNNSRPFKIRGADSPTLCGNDSYAVTESFSYDIFSGNTINCSGGGTPAHAYGRSHNLATSLVSGISDLGISCVHFAMQANDSAVNAIVRVYEDLDGGSPSGDGSDLSLIAESNLTIPAGSGYVTASFSGESVPVDATVFVEIEIGASSGQAIPGSNNLGETSDSYLRTLDGSCGISNWTPFSGIGFSNVHLVEVLELAVVEPVDPCDLPLDDECPADLNLDGQINTLDLLAIISEFTSTGDGTFRPSGDVAPGEFGDCTVNTIDLLEVVGNYGQLCTLDGACCLPSGTCEFVLEEDCAAVGGVFQGVGVFCITVSCPVEGTGACCVLDSCVSDYNSFGCYEAGGAFQGGGSSCLDVICQVGETIADAVGTGTVRAEGVNYAEYFFNIQGSDNGQYASYGLARFDNASIRSQLDATYGLGNWNISTIDILLTQANASFTTDGLIDFYWVDNDLVDISPNSTEVQYPFLADPNVQDDENDFPLAELLIDDASFVETASGDQNSYRLYTSGDSGSIASDIMVDNFTTIAVVDADPTVSATYAGVGNNSNPGPALRISVSLGEPAPGACCLFDGSCQQVTAVECSNLGGLFRGPESQCASDCDAGACCLLDGTCSDSVNAYQCILEEGGSYRGGAVLCADAICPSLPSGSCCFSDGSCENTNSLICGINGGTYSGDGTLCAAVNCAIGGGSTSLAVTEWSSNPFGSDSSYEFTEIFNYGSETINLLGWELTDLNTNSYIFDDSVNIGPGQFVIIARSPIDFISNWGVGVENINVFQCDNFFLSNGSDVLALIPPYEISPVWQVSYDTVVEGSSTYLTSSTVTGTDTFDTTFYGEYGSTLIVIDGEDNVGVPGLIGYELQGGTVVDPFARVSLISGCTASPLAGDYGTSNATGACCLSDGTCEIVDIDNCAGIFGGPGTDCGFCDTGACCFESGGCSDVTAADCATGGGNFYGTGADCSSAGCPQPPVGNCCFGSADSCQGLSSFDCADSGGTYFGDAEVPCDGPICSDIGGGTTVSYDWEDGGSYLGTSGNIDEVLSGNSDEQSRSGLYSLKIVENPIGGTPQAWVAWITGLQDGDVIDASFWVWDDTPNASPRGRIWAHYGLASDGIGSNEGSASGNSTYSGSSLWSELSHQWIFNSNGGERDSLIIEVRMYSPSGDPVDPPTIYVDDLTVSVEAANPDGVGINVPAPPTNDG